MTEPASRDLPRGTVTFLATDIEGSTRTLRELGSEYTAALSRHRELVRAAYARYDGREVDTQGDSFLVAFARATDAVAAAAQAQQALGAEHWPGETALRVRMGVHTGEPELGPEGYVGLDVHLVARISAAAYGGQVLVSRATRDIVGDEPIAGASMRDVGDHRLKDFDRPVRLFQLEGPGMSHDRRPPRTGSAVGLPVPSNRLIGRDAELEELRALLAAADVHLVTLTGPGGAGKSRLALELAWEAVDRYADGVFLVRLAPIGDPELVPSAIATALGIREAGSRPLLETVIEHLRERETLLVLDNFEHVAAAAGVVASLAENTPRVEVLVTSRFPLRLRGERAVTVDPLGPDDATTLFVERARAADHRFDENSDPESIREICRRLDGLPLAIELAAARISLLSPQALLERLSIALLSGGAADLPSRQQTLAATIDWSYELLTPSQRALHSSLGVFAGGCSLEAIEAVGDVGDDLLDDMEALVRGGLLQRDDVAHPRFRLLQTVREYTLQRLAEAGRAVELGRRHLRWVESFARQAEAGLAGPEQASWLGRVEEELPNVRAALDWSLAHGEPEATLVIASALSRFWRAHGHPAEARGWLTAGLAQGIDAAPDVRADALWTAGRQAMAQADDEAATALLEDALELFRRLGRRRDEVFALSELGLAAARAGDLAAANSHCEAALAVARELDDQRAISGALTQSASVAAAGGDHERARLHHEEALEIRRRLGDPLLIANALNNLGVAALAAGDLERAEEALGETLEIAREIDDAIHTAGALCGLGQTAALRDETGRAADLLTESLDLYARLGAGRDCAECVATLAAVEAGAGHSVDSCRLWGAADALREGAALGPVERTLEERFRPLAAQPLAAGERAAAEAEGARLTPDEIVRIARETALPDRAGTE